MPPDTTRPVLQTIGNYDLLEKIAEGGMGAIWKGRHRQTGQVVALKVMPPHIAANPVLLKRFEQEFRAASRLDHPNIVRALDYGDTGTTPYLVMEYVEGESLGHKLERDGRMSEADAIRLISQVAKGLHRAHKQGLIHRDVKPDNILVTPDGLAKLADLGLVKEMETDLNLTRTGRGLGTPHFMAPEQFRNAKNATVGCDIYSLGATLYQVVTGELPFRASGPLDAFMKKIQNDLTPPRRLVPELSERVEWAILRAMSADPKNRPGSCREFIEDLTGHSTHRVATAEVAATTDLWYLVYKDDGGEVHTVKGTTAAIRRSLRDGLLGDAANVRASRFKAGPFEPLRGHPEFRDLVVTAAPLSLPAPSSARPAVAAAPTPSDALANEPTQPFPAPGARPSSVSPPQIDLQPGSGDGLAAPEWFKWLVMLLVALATSLGVFFLLRWR
jgi:eukaryotic-like serine/threonine-protein kinase